MRNWGKKCHAVRTPMALTAMERRLNDADFQSRWRARQKREFARSTNPAIGLRRTSARK
jgi:hypothetical protein